jgi:alpha-ketoglutarate-dependent taurine dioxygenase
MIKVQKSDGNFGAVITGVSTDRVLSAKDMDLIRLALAEHTAIIINDLDENPEWLLKLGQHG